MNQILDIVGSYLLGGIVVLALIGLTFFLSTKSQETTLSQITQYTVAETGRVVENDMEKIGYRVTSGSKIVALSADSISFRGDLNNDGSVNTVKLYAQNNNNHLTLFKIVDGSAKWSMPVKSFSIQGIDSAGNKTINTANIKSLIVSMVTQEKTIDDSQNSIGAFWKRQIYPKNL